MLYRRNGSTSQTIKENIEKILDRKLIKPSRTAVLIPFYKQPNINDTEFLQLLSLLRKYKEVPTLVVLKPTVSDYDVTLHNMIKLLNGTGTSKLIYIDTSNKTIDNVKTEAERYKSMYPEIDGIYFDNLIDNPIQTEINQYKSMNSYLTERGIDILIGKSTNKTYLTEAGFDILIVSEGTIDLNTINTNYPEISYQSLGAILTNISFDRNYVKNLQQYLGLIYLTDKQDYISLTSYLEDLLLLIDTEPDIITFTKDNKVGINTVNPKNILEIAGSLGLPIRETTTDTSLIETDFTLLVDTTNNNVTVTLPDANLAENRTYLIKKISEDTNTLTINNSSNVPIVEITEKDRAVLLQSDGSQWYILFDTASGSAPGSEGSTILVDNITIDFNNAGQLQVKDDGITANKIAPNVDVSNKGFNADKVDGYDVNNNNKTGSLWSGERITKEAIVKAIIFG